MSRRRMLSTQIASSANLALLDASTVVVDTDDRRASKQTEIVRLTSPRTPWNVASSERTTDGVGAMLLLRLRLALVRFEFFEYFSNALMSLWKVQPIGYLPQIDDLRTFGGTLSLGEAYPQEWVRGRAPHE